MELKCLLLNRMVEAKEGKFFPEDKREGYEVYYCNLCEVAECREDKEYIEAGADLIFGSSAIVLEGYKGIKSLM